MCKNEFSPAKIAEWICEIATNAMVQSAIYEDIEAEDMAYGGVLLWKLRRGEVNSMYRETTQFHHLFDLEDQIHLKLHRYFLCHLRDFTAAN
jgi:hypothetical protein